MAKRTTEELAQQLADMKWGDSLSDLEMGANEARALGRAFVALRQQLEAVKPEAVKPEADDGWIEWRGGVCPVDGETMVVVKFSDGTMHKKPTPALTYRWTNEKCHGDIIAYRVVS